MTAIKQAVEQRCANCKDLLHEHSEARYCLFSPTEYRQMTVLEFDYWRTARLEAIGKTLADGLRKQMLSPAVNRLIFPGMS